MNEINIQELKGQAKGLLLILLVIVGVVTAMGSFYTVGPDEQAVIIRLGRYLETNGSGLHFKLPLGLDKLYIVKTERVLQQEFGFRTEVSSYRGRTRYAANQFDDESLMLSGDLNVADVEWVVHYRIAGPFRYLFKTKEQEKNIRDVSESIMRRVVGDRSVTEVLTTGRVEIENEAKALIQEVLDRYEMGVLVGTVALQDVNPPDSVKASFNEVNEAKQEQEKLINQAERQYNTVIPEAKGKAQRKISEAEGYANALTNRAVGDAEKFQALLLEYRKAPVITKKRLYLETMEALFKRFKDVTIVDAQVKGLLPVFTKGGGASL